jgi:outer membrane murein-binding lipoprotein Lpp
MIWWLGLLVLLVALGIPVVAIVLHSPYSHSLASRSKPEETDRISELGSRVQTLEDDVDELTHAVSELREETQFLHNVLPQPDRPPPLAPFKS